MCNTQLTFAEFSSQKGYRKALETHRIIYKFNKINWSKRKSLKNIKKAIKKYKYIFISTKRVSKATSKFPSTCSTLSALSALFVFAFPCRHLSNFSAGTSISNFHMSLTVANFSFLFHSEPQREGESGFSAFSGLKNVNAKWFFLLRFFFEHSLVESINLRKRN